MKAFPRWVRNLEHLPGINLTVDEMTDPLLHYAEYPQWTFYEGDAAVIVVGAAASAASTAHASTRARTATQSRKTRYSTAARNGAALPGRLHSRSNHGLLRPLGPCFLSDGGFANRL